MNSHCDRASNGSAVQGAGRFHASHMSFDGIASHYRWLEWVTAGSLLQRCRTTFLPEIKDARDILLLGEGRGRFLIEIVRQNPNARITCVDASARMLDLTRIELLRRADAAGHEVEGRGRTAGFGSTPVDRVRFVHSDILNGSWCGGSPAYDAVASHFFLDCFRPDQLEQIVSMVAAATIPGGRWLISDFCVPERGWQRVRARLILAGLYAFFRVMTRLPATRLTAPDALLKSAGFRLRDRRRYNHGLLHSDLWVDGS